jgi:hypothetical protein
MEDEELGWVAVRANEGRFYRSVPVVRSFYDTLETIDELGWPELHLVGKRVERSHLSLVTGEGELHVSRNGSVPVRRLGPTDTQSHKDWSVTRAATSGEGSFTYVIAVVEDIDLDTLPEIVFAYGPTTGRLLDLRLPEARPDGLDWPEEVSVIEWEGEVWVSATWRAVMTGTRRVTWLKYGAPAP